jgi:hypothetical protein
MEVKRTTAMRVGGWVDGWMEGRILHQREIGWLPARKEDLAWAAASARSLARMSSSCSGGTDRDSLSSFSFFSFYVVHVERQRGQHVIT